MSEGLVVARVERGGIADQLEIRPGDEILSVDGAEVKDIIDFQYLTAEDVYTILVKARDGAVIECEIEQEPGEILGLEFRGVGPEGLKFCRNHCVFCFVAQMPPGLRPTLYARDDDYRLSLTQGSFITLSNLTEEEFERVLKFHLSPLYISVHAWDAEARRTMMRNPRTGDIGKQLTRLAEGGITLHTQIVLVPGYNDGKVLEETVHHLAALFPAVQSIGVVPVGLTRFRAGLPPLRPCSPEEAREVLRAGEGWQREFQAAYDRHLVYLADEFYVLGGWELPGAEVYDDFPQLENGVGMASKFRAEIESVWQDLPARVPPRRLHLITGVSALKFFEGWRDRLCERIQGLDLRIIGVVNNFFGPEVTVAGLLTAGDIAAQVGKLKGEDFLIPEVMLKTGEDLFLDERDPSWLEEQVEGKCIVVANDGRAFLKAILGAEWEGDNID
ncbi:radical SAM superfamily protein [Peptococcaceae bacterium CEB3]|nr:radical SAM superfamily protein [Peptococcaceae bacterium CEB3]